MHDLDTNWLVALATFVFFAGMTWRLLGTAPDWARVLTGIAAAILAIAALFALF